MTQLVDSKQVVCAAHSRTAPTNTTVTHFPVVDVLDEAENKHLTASPKVQTCGCDMHRNRKHKRDVVNEALNDSDGGLDRMMADVVAEWKRERNQMIDEREIMRRKWERGQREREQGKKELKEKMLANEKREKMKAEMKGMEAEMKGMEAKMQGMKAEMKVAMNEMTAETVCLWEKLKKSEAAKSLAAAELKRVLVARLET